MNKSLSEIRNNNLVLLQELTLQLDRIYKNRASLLHFGIMELLPYKRLLTSGLIKQICVTIEWNNFLRKDFPRRCILHTGNDSLIIP